MDQCRNPGLKSQEIMVEKANLWNVGEETVSTQNTQQGDEL